MYTVFSIGSPTSASPETAFTVASPLTPPYQYLCGSCAESLILAHPPNCKGCGSPYPSGSHRPKVCPHCAHLRPAYACAHCLCLAKKAGRQIIHQLKYACGFYLFADLKYIISQRRDLKTICADARLVPVPLHPTKERERGYNQSQIIERRLQRKACVRISESKSS